MARQRRLAKLDDFQDPVLVVTAHPDDMDLTDPELRFDRMAEARACSGAGSSGPRTRVSPCARPSPATPPRWSTW
jgi:hypothetical protein